MAEGFQMVHGFGHLSFISSQEVDAGHDAPTKRSTSMERQQADALPFRGVCMVAPVVLVAVGGAFGAVLRWILAPSPDAEGVPWGTLGVNLLGSLLLGVMTVLLAEAILTREQALALGTGLLGAFTTMSTFAVELVRMVDGGDRLLAAGYLFSTLVGCPLLAWVGWSLAESMTA
jgi:CrcB protein